MIKKYNFIYLCICFVFISNIFCNQKMDLIEFIKIDAGKTDTLELEQLFYAEKYDVKFNSDSGLSIQYNKKTKQLICQPEGGFSGLTFIRFFFQDREFVIPVIVRKKPLIRFECKPDIKVKNVFVMGSFNSWNRSSHPMFDPDGDGIFTTTIPLDDGMYEYQFVIDKREVWDKENPEKVDNGFGGFNSIKRVKSEQKELAPSLYFLPSSNPAIIRIAVQFSGNTRDLELTVLNDNQLLPDNFYSIKNNQVEINGSAIKNKAGLHTLRIVASNNNVPGNILSVWMKDGKILPGDDFSIWQDVIMYSLMIDRFCNGDPSNDRKVIHPELDDQANFQGGDFAGIMQKIEEGYFDSLGINTLWIFPVNKTTNKAYQEWPEPKRYFSGYHGYWPVAARQTEPRFGSFDQFKRLVDTAHRHNMLVLLDFISNHTHIEHPYFQKHRNWFGKVDLPGGKKNIRLWDTYRLTTWFDTFLPSFDYIGAPAALETVTDDAVWWLMNTGIDGFRHDATKHVPYSFWSCLTHKIKKEVNPEREIEIFQIGETFGGDDLIKSFINNSMLNAQFNFNQFFTARRIFVDSGGHFQDLVTAIDKAMDVYGYHHTMGNLMDSHDQVRMMALLEGDLSLAEDGNARAWKKPKVMVDEPLTYNKAQVFLTYCLTVPGVPIIYYGDEIGMTGAGDPDNRRMMRFSGSLSREEQKHLKHITKLIRVRKEHTALRRGDYFPVYFDQNIFIYSRGDTGERLLIVLNKGEKEKQVQIILPGWLEGKYLTSLLHKNKTEINNGKIDLFVPSWSADIYRVF